MPRPRSPSLSAARRPSASAETPRAVLLITATALSACATACGRAEEPPGRSIEQAAALPPILPAPEPRLPPCPGGASAPPADPCLAAPEDLASAGAGAGAARRQDTEPGYGAKIASIAMRTWIYVAPNDRSTKLGYLRAGAVVDRAEVSAGTTNCAGGWYRIVPRGYVCVGKGATLSLDHPIVQAAVRGPDRAALTPYKYVISRSPPPHLYFRLPSRKDQERVEGSRLGSSLSRVAAFSSLPPDPVPEFLLAGRDLPKPYGSEAKLRYSVHAGKAREESAFGLITTFEWTNRRFGLTTELDLIPLDRTRPATISALRGVVLSPDLPPVRLTRGGPLAGEDAKADGAGSEAAEAKEPSPVVEPDPASVPASALASAAASAPVPTSVPASASASASAPASASASASAPASASASASASAPAPASASASASAPASADSAPVLTPAFVIHQGVTKMRLDAKGNLREDGLAPYHSGWGLTGRNNGSPRGMLETSEGVWLPAESLVIAHVREDPAGYAREGKKWIDVSIKRQMLVAYEGKRPVFATLVSTGIGELGDPEKTHATIRGTFLIHSKHISGTMDGDEATDSFDLRDVPYIQYFHEGFALHGAYWHDEFGKARSHGCVNLAPADAAWLFEWTDPIVPPEWHGAINLEGGTLVYTHA